MKTVRAGGVLSVILMLSPVAQADCSLDSDDQAIFFPVAAAQRESGAWETTVRGWVFEKKSPSAHERLLLSGLRKALRLPESAEENVHFRERGSWFVVDNERGKCVNLQLNGQSIKLPPTDPAGRVESRLTFTSSAWRITFRTEGVRVFNGQIFLVPPQGLSVISDIDDTIKISDVLDHSRLLARTFLEPYEAVPGMVDLYRQWQKDGAVFHYVSGSPSPLYPALRDFLQTSGFPEGTIHLRPFRPKSRELLIIKEPSHSYKKAIIEDLLRQFPKRQVILVGDSGEGDPEVYGDVARRHPHQIYLIAIRQVRGEESRGRFERAFRELRPNRWMVFRSPTDLPANEIKNRLMRETL